MSILQTDHTQHPLLKANNITLELGMVNWTPGALDAIAEYYSNTVLDIIKKLLIKHRDGEWSELTRGDALRNLDDAITGDGHIVSAYTLPFIEEGETRAEQEGTKIWVITEWDRSSTMILLPQEY